jgi:hypothetical protein
VVCVDAAAEVRIENTSKVARNCPRALSPKIAVPNVAKTSSALSGLARPIPPSSMPANATAAKATST